MTIQERVVEALKQGKATRGNLVTRVNEEGAYLTGVQVGNALRLLKGQRKVRLANGARLGNAAMWEVRS